MHSLRSAGVKFTGASRLGTALLRMFLEGNVFMGFTQPNPYGSRRPVVTAGRAVTLLACPGVPSPQFPRQHRLGDFRCARQGFCELVIAISKAELAPLS